jgi:hypothetical protein
MNWPGIKPGLLWWESGDYCLSYDTGQMDFLRRYQASAHLSFCSFNVMLMISVSFVLFLNI